MTPPKHDIFAWIDIPAALGLLTRLPVRLNTDAATARGARSAWAYPVVGLIIGGIACGLTTPLIWLGLPAPLAAALWLAITIILTGAMHEDGLADTADGLWGGWTVARRLEIMKDSQIGTYGTLALVLSVLIRWQALNLLLAHSQWTAPIAAACLSRAAMVGLMAALPHARPSGLSQSVGRPRATTALIACGAALLICLILTGPQTIILGTIAATTTVICGVIALSKIKGQTGDILGATQQIAEIMLLCLLASTTP